ncbi:MAG TPA: glycosyltransferase [Planctomycetota bacterium]|nr:glycosyltransferase [Planctomycetota bacterium]
MHSFSLTPFAAARTLHRVPAPRLMPSNPSRPRVAGKFLFLRDEPLFLRGVTYGTFADNSEDGTPFPPIAQVRADFAMMRAAGVNTVRIYSPPSERVADAAADAGLFLVADFCWGMRACELDCRGSVRAALDWTRRHARRLADHPALLMFGIGNEVPPLLVRWYGRARFSRHLRELCCVVKEEVPHAIVTYANHPPTEHLVLPFLDVVSYNVYLEREPDFRSYLARLQLLAGNRPLFLAELGVDSRSLGEGVQARVLDWQVRAAIEHGLCGTAVYSWTDEWSVHGHRVDGWRFGLVGHDRRPKPAMAAVAAVYGSDRHRLRPTPWPSVSVVVCSYNGGATLDECLRSLAALSYPNREVIVVDDGSTDDTQAILARHHVRVIRVPNGGLSRARNLGIEAATGEIVAFLDSDAFADPHWLTFLVTALERQGAAAVGGPNLAVPGDGFTAQCVDHAPGNPTHVLRDNELAEHVPGCNMAFQKQALREIGLFDPDHRAAGDDVDVCWKLLLRQQRIAFSAAAVVWHHRRGTVRAFLRQQRGYGIAEGHLRRRYLSRFNQFGDLVWRGNLYDSHTASLRDLGMPRVFRPRIYHGPMGSAQFQSLYQPFVTWWFQVFTTAEWQVTSWCVLATAALAGFTGAAAAASVIGVAMLAATLTVAVLPGCQAAATRRWRGTRLLRGVLCVAMLHLLQPLVRCLGQIEGWWRTRDSKPEHSNQRLRGDLGSRHVWLERLQRQLAETGWRCHPGGAWDGCDLLVDGPGPYRLRLVSVIEEDHARASHYVRFRVDARPKLFLPCLWLLLVASFTVVATHPATLPMLLPLGYVAWNLLVARRNTVAAVVQLAVQVGKALDMAADGEG